MVLTNKRILICAQYDVQTMHMKTYLQSHGATVVQCESFLEVITSWDAENDNINLVIFNTSSTFDQVYKQVQSLPQYGVCAPVLVLSYGDFARHGKLVMDSGIEAICFKPCGFNCLLDVMKRVVR
jgi:response regulator RpfG family c-di-GMP phosphodiesterase